MSLTTGFLFKYDKSDNSHGLHNIIQLPNYVLHEWHQYVAEFAAANNLSDRTVTAWVGQVDCLAGALETELVRSVLIAIAIIMVRSGYQWVLEESLEILNYLVWRNFMEP